MATDREEARIIGIIFALLLAAGGVLVAFDFAPQFGSIDLVLTMASGVYLIASRKEVGSSFLSFMCAIPVSLNALATISILFNVLYMWASRNCQVLGLPC
jgi:uncharacterized membrane protein YwaF